MVTSHDAEMAANPSLHPGDLGPLAWVLDETRKSVESATKALKRYAHAAETARGVDLASVDANQLRVARQQLHQVAGALDMVEQGIAAQMVRGMETVVQKLVLHPERCDAAIAARMEHAGFALVEYLEAQLGQRPRSAIGLFPQYRQVLEEAGAERIHPADLWQVPWRWADPVMPAAAQRLGYEPSVRGRLDQRILKVMRHADANAAAELALISLGVAEGESRRQLAVFWKLAAAFFEAVGAGALSLDVYVKRTASGVLLQYAALSQGAIKVPEQLCRDLLFFCAQARPAAGARLPMLAAVRSAWGLSEPGADDYGVQSFGLYDPALLAQARRRVEAIKENWSALAGGDMARLKPSLDQLSLVAESIEKLHPHGKPLADALGRVAQQVRDAAAPPNAELAMETATAILYLEAAFADFQPTGSRFTARMAQLASRLDEARTGAPVPPLEPWMEELYRTVSDRQTLGTVVGELRATLDEVEQHLDQFFRNPVDKSVLNAVPTLLSQMRGVLSVLDLEQAAAAMGAVRDTVDGLLVEELDPGHAVQPGVFEKLGHNLGTLGLLVDMLGYQPVLARKLFAFDAEAGELRHVAGRQAAAEEIGDADGLGADDAVDTERSMVEPSTIGLLSPEVERAFAELDGDSASVASGAEAVARPGSVADIELDLSLDDLDSRPAVTPEESAVSDDDDELLDIFLEEAREVVATGQGAVDELAQVPGDLEQQTTLRRAFHTLKGSSRMVGLVEFGEAAWSLEQLLNAWLAEHKPVSADLRELASEALQAFGRWADDIAAKRAELWRAEPFQQAADALRLQGLRLPIALDAGAPQAATQVPAVAETGFASAAEVVAPGSPSQLPEAGLKTGPTAAASGVDAESAPAAAPVVLPALDLPDLELPSESRTQDVALGDGAASSAQIESAEDISALPEVVDIDFDIADLEDESPAATLPAAIDAEAESEVSTPGQPERLAPWVDGVEVTDPTDSALTEESSQVPAAESSVEASMVSDAESEWLALELEELDFTAADAPGPVPAETPTGVEPEPEPVSVPSPEAEQSPVEAVPSDGTADDDLYKQIGDLQISTPLYNVYLNEADEWSRQLVQDISEWTCDLSQPVPERAIAGAHSLAGSSATVGLHSLSELARAVEHALQRLSVQCGGTAHQADVIGRACEDIRRVLHQFAVGLLKDANADIVTAVHALEPDPALLAVESPSVETEESLGETFSPPGLDDTVPAPDETVPPAVPIIGASVMADHIDERDDVDPDLFEIFDEEAEELMPQLAGAMRQWMAAPSDLNARAQALRVLHTLKGSARLAGALRLGEMAHRMESAIEMIGVEGVLAEDIEPVLDQYDELHNRFRQLQAIGAGDSAVAMAAPADTSEPTDGDSTATVTAVAAAAAVPQGEVALPVPLSMVSARAAATQAVRVRAQLLDRLVVQAGEVMTSRARLESEVGQLRGSLNDLTGNLERLRQQLRDVELQAETQMQSRLALSKDAQQNFDPLEFDRFTRMQELTRMMAESVNDVATVQRSLQRAIEASEDDLAAQARQSRELQHDLLRTRMVEFEGISERLYRVVRQASKETDKQVRLDITGGAIEMDRGILDRMTPAFEHLLRNCVVHGIEAQELRLARGKDPIGLVTIDVQQAGNDVAVEFRDDGGGLDLERIRERALQQGLISPEDTPSEEELGNLVFASGFTTVTELTGLAGRGVGMDVVRTEVLALGGRIETSTRTGQGASFRLVLPLTTAVTHVVMIRSGALVVGVPSNLVEIVQRASAKDVQQAYNTGTYAYGEQTLPFFWSGALLQSSARSTEPQGRSIPVVVFRSADQRVAVHVDEVLGNQEVVVKALGPQLSRLPGLVAITALASGAVALVYNPVALAAVYGEQARAMSADHAQPEVIEQEAGTPSVPVAAAPASDIPLVLVVDDSITVRRVTQRLLQREGYRVALAADGLQGLERLQGERPAVVLSDIEMPRMDGFDFVRNIRADEHLRDLPVIMITSRIAEKHREHARQLGVDHYLGKPYSEDELLALVKQYAHTSGASVMA